MPETGGPVASSRAEIIGLSAYSQDFSSEPDAELEVTFGRIRLLIMPALESRSIIG
jgi:hypothetical protein